MKNSSLIQILSKLSETEFIKFGKFVDSSYFNSNKKLIAFYKILEEHYPDFESLTLSKENIYRKLYKEDKVVEGTVYYLISEMESLLEKFMGLEKLEPVTLEMTFLKELTKLGLHNLFDSKYNEIRKKLSGSPDEMNINNFLLSEIRRDNSILKREFLTKKYLKKTEWIEPSHELLKLYLKNNLRNILFLGNHNMLINDFTEIPMMKETLEYIEAKKVYNIDLEIKVLYFEIKLLLYNDTGYYDELKSVLIKDKAKLSSSLFKELVSILYNYNVITKIAGGVDFDYYDKENFELSNLYIKNISNNKHEKIPIDAFFAFFNNGISFGKFEWVRELIDKYSKRLEEKFQNNAVCYGDAVLFYHRGEFDKALKSLSGIKTFSYLGYKSVVRVLQLRIFYELGLFSEAEDAAKTYKQFLRNDKLLSAKARTVGNDFLKVYFKLLNISQKTSLKKIQDLQSELKNHKRMLSAHLWFDEKLRALESRLVKKVRAS